MDEEEKPEASDRLRRFVEMLRGEALGRMSASTASEIKEALTLPERFDVRLLLYDVVEGWTVPELVSEYPVYPVVSPRNLPRPEASRRFPSGGRIQQARIFRDHGVPFLLSPPRRRFSKWGISGRDYFTYPLEGAFAVRGGLGEQDALEALTIKPARVFGVQDRLGSIERGKDADLIVTTGNLLHYKTLVDVAIVNGRVRYRREDYPLLKEIDRR